MIQNILQILLAVLSAVVALLYWRRASIGLEQHLKKVAIGFGVMSVFELFSIASIYRSTTDVMMSQLVAPFGPLSLVGMASLIISIVILALWTWYYLLKRLSTQLFIISISGVVVLSLLITGIFVSLLLSSIEKESLSKLDSNARVVSSMLDKQRQSLLSEAKLLAMNPELIKGIEENDRKLVFEQARSYMLGSKVSSVTIVDKSGKVIAKGENEEEKGGSLSDDKYVSKAIQGNPVSGVSVVSGAIAPKVMLSVAVPIEGQGAILLSYVLDNAYVDGLKKDTGMTALIYGDKTLSASSVDIGDGVTRLQGIKELDNVVLSRVYDQAQVVAIQSRLGDSEYLSAYVPLTDLDNVVVGVLQVAQPQVVAWKAAGWAIQMTFGLIMAIMALLAIPINLICRKLVADWT